MIKKGIEAVSRKNAINAFFIKTVSFLAESMR